ncbi:hypothetical protein GH714_001446 [Hevea brasiliensis]|uniref:Disease resistance protein At4g27190-like leucine-rich repeats domain-containing protein n=1 Tax=Hevea brasiliensis TaxID=3981 RepID=A0A6A6KH31_HEVBR|nr:hypothetical protein GH714_001446 [Hevea brasiliensis]
MEIFGSYHTKKLWHNQVAPGSFDELKKLTIANCKALETVFPQGVWSNFKTLEVLSVANCDSLQEIYQVQEESIVEETNLVVDFELRELHREGLHSHQGVAFHHLRSVKVSNCKVLKDLIPASIACKGLLQLREINVEYCYMMEEIIKLEAAEEATSNLISFPSLISIDLLELPTLSSFYSGSYNLECPSLKRIKINGCPKIDLSNNAPFFDHKNLTTLDVENCNGLINLLTSSVAISMVQLVTMTVSECRKLTEVVADEQDGTTEEISFSKLKTLKLFDLSSLTSFCKGNCIFQFPSLEQVIVGICPKMMIFSPGSLSTPNLKGIQSSKSSSESDLRWAGNLNDTIEQMYMEMVGFQRFFELNLSEFPRLKENWHRHSPLPFELLIHLGELTVENCELFSCAISSNVVKFLNKLTHLIVKKCDLIEEVFDLEGQNAEDGKVGLMSQLQTLDLIDLPRLRHLWSIDAQRILCFQNLKFLEIHNCGNLTNIFTLSMAMGLVSLHEMKIKGCALVEEIITKEEEQEEGWNKTIFPSLSLIVLKRLPSLQCFYSGSDVLECPSLEDISVVDCPKMKILASTFSREQDSSMNVEENKERICEGDSDLPAPHVFNGKVAVQRLHTLRVAWSELMEIWCHKFQSKSFHKLGYIKLTCFPGESAILSSDFFQRLPNLRALALSDSLIEEIFLHQVRTDEHRYLAFLKLSKLPKLKHLAENDYSQTISAFQFLKDLIVVECGGLKVLVPSSISFPNLTTLTISKCHGLVNLMPLSAARSLGQLQSMSVRECEMLQQIVASEGDGVEDEICFSILQYLNLDRLPCLASFCSGNHAFNFPSLETMIVTECPKMKFFAQGVLSTPKLLQVQKKWGHLGDNWRWEGNLNDTIQELFMEMVRND